MVSHHRYIHRAPTWEKFDCATIRFIFSVSTSALSITVAFDAKDNLGMVNNVGSIVTKIDANNYEPLDVLGASVQVFRMMGYGEVERVMHDSKRRLAECAVRESLDEWGA